MALEEAPTPPGIELRCDAEGRKILEAPPEGYHPGVAIGMLFWGCFMILGGLTAVQMASRGSTAAALVGGVFCVLGAWSTHRAWTSSRAPRRITDLGSEVEIGYVVRGSVELAKAFPKDEIHKLAIQPIWKRRGGLLGALLGASTQSPAQPHDSHLHAIFIRSSRQVETLGFGLDEAGREWLLAAIRRMIANR